MSTKAQKKKIMQKELEEYLLKNSKYISKNFIRYTQKTLTIPRTKAKFEEKINEMKKEDKDARKQVKKEATKEEDIKLQKLARKVGYKGKLSVPVKQLKQIVEKKLKKKDEPLLLYDEDFVKPKKEKKLMKFKLYLSFSTNPLSEEEAMLKRGKKNPIGLEFHMTKEGERFQIALDASDKADHQEIVESSKDLITLYPIGHMIQHYKKNIVNGEVTKDWKKFFESFGQSEGREFDNRLDTIIDTVRYIRIEQIDYVDEYKERELREKSKLLKQKIIKQRRQEKMRKQKVYDSIASISCFPWIKIDYDRNLAKGDIRLLFKPKIQSSNKSTVCWVDLIVETYAENFITYQKKKHRKNIDILTPEYLLRLCGLKPEDKDLGLSLDLLIECWFKPNRLALVVFDKFEGVICKYHPSDDGKKIVENFAPKTLYLLATNRHIEKCNEGLGTLAQIVEKKLSDPMEVSENFYLPTEQNKTPHFLLDHLYEIRTIKWDEISKSRCKKVNVTLQETSLASVFSYFRDVCGIIPRIESKGHDILSAVTVKVDDLNVTFRNPENDRVLGQLKFNTNDNNLQYDTFQDLKYKMNESLMNPETLSTFNDLDILTMTAAKPVKYRIRTDLETTHYVDRIKAYTGCILEIDNLAVGNKFDGFIDYIEFQNEPIRDEYFYVVQRMSTNGLSDANKHVFLRSEFTDFQGTELKLKWEEIKDNVQIIACYTITNLVSNIQAKQMIKQIYDSKILSEAQKKFIVNQPSGMLEKSKNKDSRNVLIEDRFEAEVLGEKYGAEVSPFRYELAGDISDQEFVEIKNALPWGLCEEDERLVKGNFWYKKGDKKGEESEYDSDCDYDSDSDSDSDEEEGDSIFDLDKYHEALKEAEAERKKNNPEIWNVELKKTKQLVNGFYFIKMQIYSKMRYLLTKMYEDVVKLGGIPTAIHTDCIFFHLPQGIPFKENLDIDGSKFENIGKYKWRKLGETIIPKNPFTDLLNPYLVKKLEKKEYINSIRERMKNFKKRPITHSVLVLNEHLWKTNPKKYLDEVITLIENGGRCVIIQGQCAGVGKTFVASEYGKRMQALGKKVLAVGPTTKRVKELRDMLGEENAMTLHKLLKLRVMNGEAVEVSCRKKKKKVNHLEGVEVLIIDEVFAFQVKMLGRMKSKIIEKFPNLKIIATGDPFQSRICDVKVADIDGYYKDAVATMFSYGILLQINKRMATEKDCVMLNDIKYALQNNLKIPHVQKINQIKEIIERHINNGTFTGQILCYYRDTAKYVSNLIQEEIVKQNPDKNWTYLNGMIVCEGQELINRIWWKAQGQVMNVNNCFTVSRIYEYAEIEAYDDGSKVSFPKTGIEIVDDLTGKLYFVKESQLKYFAYPYCVTIHSSQGDTYSNCPITLLDFDGYYITKNDKYVALSRSNRIENMRIYTGHSLRVSEAKINAIIKTRISGHKNEDNKKGRTFKEEDYVNQDWVHKMLSLQEMKCGHPDCRCELSLIESDGTSFSIDRKDNRFAHIKSNCIIACRKCNISRKELISLSI
jgi:hypothetical protein